MPREHDSTDINRKKTDRHITSFFRPLSSSQLQAGSEKHNSRSSRIAKNTSHRASPPAYSPASLTRSKTHDNRQRSNRLLSKMEGSIKKTVRFSNMDAVKYNREELPKLVAQRHDINTAAFTQWTEQNPLPPLDPKKAPKYTPGIVSVWNDDTVTAALRLEAIVNQTREELLAKKFPDGVTAPVMPQARVAVVNFANAHNPGGAYKGGANAQEEAICYRTSLYDSLSQAEYPWPQKHVMYTPDVLVHRGDSRMGMPLLTEIDPQLDVQDLPVISAVSVAAEIKPPKKKEDGAFPCHRLRNPEVFKNVDDLNLYKYKVRMTLRALAHYGHSAVVLGALGCGAFANPIHDAALCWRQVLLEDEFRGWFSHVWFAVLGSVSHDGNFHIFSEYLAGIDF